MDAILGETTAGSRRQRLRAITEGLDLKDVYGAMIKRIKEQGGEKAVFRTVQSVRLGGRTGRTAGGSPSFFNSMDGLEQMGVGPDALPGPVGPYAVLLLHFFSSHTHKLGGMISSPPCVMISQIV